MALQDIFTGVGNVLAGADNVVKTGVSIFDQVNSAIGLNTDTTPTNTYVPTKPVDTAVSESPSVSGDSAALTTSNNKILLVVGAFVLFLLIGGE